jgi:hypothetical protein
VRGPSRTKAKAKARKFIYITSHDGPEDITDEAEAFVAFGTLEQFHSVDSVTMNDIDADYVVEDWGSETLFWTAYFPPLPEGTYTLTAVDSRDHRDSVDGLEVN